MLLLPLKRLDFVQNILLNIAKYGLDPPKLIHSRIRPEPDPD